MKILLRRDIYLVTNPVGSNVLENGSSDSKIFRSGRRLMFRSRQIDYFHYLVDDRYTGKNRSKSIISVNRNNEVINDFQILYGVSFGEKNVGDIFFVT